jgi:hypothetical protein
MRVATHVTESMDPMPQIHWQQESIMIYPNITHAQQPVQLDVAVPNGSYVSSYRLLLLEPTVLLAGNLNNRPDVATAAILGYN